MDASGYPSIHFVCYFLYFCTSKMCIICIVIFFFNNTVLLTWYEHPKYSYDSVVPHELTLLPMGIIKPILDLSLRPASSIKVFRLWPEGSHFNLPGLSTVRWLGELNSEVPCSSNVLCTLVHSFSPLETAYNHFQSTGDRVECEIILAYKEAWINTCLTHFKK